MMQMKFERKRGVSGGRCGQTRAEKLNSSHFSSTHFPTRQRLFALKHGNRLTDSHQGACRWKAALGTQIWCRPRWLAVVGLWVGSGSLAASSVLLRVPLWCEGNRRWLRCQLGGIQRQSYTKWNTENSFVLKDRPEFEASTRGRSATVYQS